VGEQIVQIAIPSLSTIIVAVIEMIAARDRKKAEAERKAAEDRAKLRAEESRLSMDLMSASVDLGVANAIAITEGHTNGEMAAARKAAEAAQAAYRSYVRQVAAGHMAGIC